MNRRSALKSVSILMGGALSSSAIAALMSGCQTEPGKDWIFFTDQQATLFAEIAETIMPKTDTPGAKELMLERWVDGVVGEVYSQNAQKGITEGLIKINAATKKIIGKTFMEASPKERTNALTTIDKERANYTGKGGHYFTPIKEVVLTAFFSTKVGITQVIQYETIPGQYVGCMPIEEAGNGKVWASTW